MKRYSKIKTWWLTLCLLWSGHAKRESAIIGVQTNVHFKRSLNRGRFVIKVGA